MYHTEEMRMLRCRSFILLLITVILFSCKKDQALAPEPLADIYIAGIYILPNSLDTHACYWKNGQLIRLTDDTKPSKARDILVYNGNVYVVGSYNQKPCYWENGILKTLDPNNTFTSGVVGKVIIDGSTIYLGGTIVYPGNQANQAALWKKSGQNAPQVSVLNTSWTFVSDMLLQNGQLLIPGVINGQPGYWVNDFNNPVIISNKVAGRIFYIESFNNEIYVFGYDDTGTWGHWNNNTFKSLAITYNTDVINSFAIDTKGQVYQAGYHKNNLLEQPVYWLEGVAKKLTFSGESGQAKSLAFNGDYVYITGHQGTFPNYMGGYWRNTTWHTLQSADDIIGYYAEGLYILKK